MASRRVDGLVYSTKARNHKHVFVQQPLGSCRSLMRSWRLAGTALTCCALSSHCSAQWNSGDKRSLQS